ncbi:MAG TPA: TolC family protein [Terracidiphilus sp.]|nr:TolC family protein [Terracidiphilus sp.]
MPRLPVWLLIFVGLVCVQSPAQAPSAQAAKPAITLEDALKLAQNNEPTFAAAVAESRATALQRADARAALLPSVALHNQYLYTQSNRSKAATTQGTVSDSLPIFIANNAVHEYISQGTVNETVGLGAVAAARLAGANAARAQAELEITRRGLVAAVVQLFYSVRSGGEKLAVAQRALAEASHFVDITQKRETAGESAHADVIKARLGQQQRERELGDAVLAQEKANLELGVLLYADPRTDFTLAEDTEAPILPDRKDVETAAGSNSPEVRSALASLKAGQAETLNSLGGLLPDLSLNYTYGIDAPQFSSYGPGGVRNLGYSASATVDLPIWDWFTSERKIKEARLRADAGKVALTSAQRHLLANIEEFYHEAETAQQQMASLEASVTDAREAMRLTNLRYVNGESTVLDVVDAQNTLVTSENARADGVVRYRLALAQLETLTGRL